MKKLLSFSLCLLLLLTFVGCSNKILSENSNLMGGLNSSSNSSSISSSNSSSSSSSTSFPSSSLGNNSSSSLSSSGAGLGSGASGSQGSSSPSQNEIPKPIEPEVLTKTYIMSTVDSLCVRSSNSTSSSVLGYLDKGDILSYISKVGDFYKTKFKEKTAYVSVKYSKKAEFNLASEEVENTILFACDLLGYPYVYGSERYHWGNGKLNSNFKNGEFDCSALVQYVYFKSCGVLLDLTSRAQSLNGKEVLKKDLRRGDLMFFTNDSRKNKTGIERIGHVGIYFGGNYILHTASDHAVIEEISPKRWSYYITARRVV